MIYLDYNASTPLDPQVREAMLPWLGEHYGNPSSAHAAGRPLRRAVDDARGQVAALLNAESSEIVFTSGGTEANNHVIKGVAHALRDRGRHLIISAVEHPAVSNPCHYLEELGYEITVVPVDHNGLVDPQAVAGEVRGTTVLISIMHANNEVGTIQNIREIAEIAREGGVWMHTDAAQTCGKIPTDVGALGVDFLTVAGHKLYAPAGIGALYIRRGIQIEPLHHGAGHEGGRRAGTEPVANIVALGRACDLAMDRLDHAGRMRALCDRLFDLLRAALGRDVVLLGHPDQRLPNTLAVGFRDCFGADVLARCPELCASTGAACHAGAKKHSDVLSAMNVPEDVSCGMVRLSVGSPTTEAEIDAASEMLVAAVRQLQHGTRVNR